MTTEVVKRLINVNEYYKMAEVGILKPEVRVELINGEIYQMGPIGSKHAAVVNKLASLLNSLFKDQIVIGIQNPISFDNKNEPEPDIALLKYRPDFYVSTLPEPTDVLAIIEVSDYSIKYDKEVKAPLYAAHGIEEYWIINLNNNQIEIFSNPKGDIYRETQIYKPGDELKLMGIKLYLNDLILLNLG